MLAHASSLRSCGDRAILDGVSGKPSEIAREGLEAWRNGDFDTATVMKFRSDRVVSMQDYRTEADARAATGQT